MSLVLGGQISILLVLKETVITQIQKCIITDNQLGVDLLGIIKHYLTFKDTLFSH